MLRVEIAELEDLGFNLELTGFELEEIRAFDFEESEEVPMPTLASGDKEPYQQKLSHYMTSRRPSLMTL